MAEALHYTFTLCVWFLTLPPTFSIFSTQHLNRLVVKADTASVQIPELEFEIPPCTQEGSITTVESILKQAVEGLEKEQPVRKVNSGCKHNKP